MFGKNKLKSKETYEKELEGLIDIENRMKQKIALEEKKKEIRDLKYHKVITGARRLSIAMQKGGVALVKTYQKYEAKPKPKKKRPNIWDM